MFESAKVALAVRVVVWCEVGERFNLLACGGFLRRGQSADALGLEEPPGDVHCLTAQVVELGDLFGVVCHGLGSLGFGLRMQSLPLGESGEARRKGDSRGGGSPGLHAAQRWKVVGYPVCRAQPLLLRRARDAFVTSQAAT